MSKSGCCFLGSELALLVGNVLTYAAMGLPPFPNRILGPAHKKTAYMTGNLAFVTAS